MTSCLFFYDEGNVQVQDCKILPGYGAAPRYFLGMRRKRRNMKAIIIGAGIGGLATAIALQQQGIAVRVYERADALCPLGAGLSLWPNAVHVLDKLGVGDAIRAEMPSLQHSGIYTADGATLSRIAGADMAKRFGTPSIVAHRADLARILAEAAGDVMSYGRAFTHYEQNKDAVVVHLSDGTFDTAQLLIGADGIRSAVRGQMQPKAQPVYRGYAAWRGVTTFPHDVAAARWGETWGRGRRFGLLPLSEGRVYWFAAESRAQNSPPSDHKAHLMRYFGGWAAPVPAVIEATPSDDVLYHDINSLEPLSTWTAGRVVLLGDAAHAMTPDLGQGACQALEDAVVLANTLAGSDDLQAALAAYQRERIPHTKRVQTQAREIGRIGQLGNPLAVAARNGTMQVTPSVVTLTALAPIVGHRV